MGPKPRKKCLLAGHPLTGDNLIVFRRSGGGNPKRQCRICTNANRKVRRLFNLELFKAKNRASYYRNREKRLAFLRAKYWKEKNESGR